MEKIFRIFGKEYANINQAALLLGFFTLLSQILALFRDRFIAHFIGPSPQLDAYYAAFRVPDLIFISIASLASITVIIPFILAKMDGDKVTDGARKLLNDIFTVFSSTITLVAVIAFFLMPHLAGFIAPGFAPVLQAKVVMLSRIMLLSPIFMGLSNLFGTVTQLFRKFFIYSLSPIFYNFGIIIGVLFFYPFFGINGLAMGVALGALMHFLIQFFASFSCGFTPRFSLHINFKDIRQAVIISFPRTLGLAFNNIALICIIALASYLKAGSISIFNFAYNLQTVPLNIIGVSYAVAAFPALAKAMSMGKPEEFRKNLRLTGRAIVFWSLPVMFLFVVLRAQIVRVILGSGSFSWDNTRLVAASLAVFALSILAQSMISLLSRAYYANGQTRQPLIINMLCSILIIILSYVFTHLFEHVAGFRYFLESLLRISDLSGTEVICLPLAYSVGTFINFLLHWIFVKRDFMHGEPFIAKTFFQSLGASFFIGIVAYAGLNILSPIFGLTTFWGVFFQGFISGIAGIAAGVLVLYLLKNEELIALFKVLHTKFWRTRVVTSAEENL
ncbi:MAG TPA: murein biosynthesis integral membrane protein MurJ [Candidatus Paceibacterota bacterium]|nr:murein biosynthesis integral membrane protein MurJ [Candidatus Paceibacterota bacterium]